MLTHTAKQIFWVFFFCQKKFVRSKLRMHTGNYGNLFSRIFDKNFVKATLLLKNLLKSWFHGKKFRWVKFRVFPYYALNTLWRATIYATWMKSTCNVYSKLVTKFDYTSKTRFFFFEYGKTKITHFSYWRFPYIPVTWWKTKNSFREISVHW